MEGELDWLARSMEMGSAFGSLGFCGSHESAYTEMEVKGTKERAVGYVVDMAIDILLLVQAAFRGRHHPQPKVPARLDP